MEIEIERKAWIKDFNKLKSIVSKKMSFVKNVKKSDIYYFNGDFENIDFKNDKIFRIRKIDNYSFITYKHREFIGKTEINKENEFPITETDRMIDFFKYLGFKILVKKNKESFVYRYKEANVELNHVENLGDFIEVEVVLEDETKKNEAIELISEIFTLLDIDENLIEDRYYIDLLLEKENKIERS